MTDKDELFKGIDEAANNLFDQYIVKRPETAPPPPQPELELGEEPDLDIPPPAPEKAASPQTKVPTPQTAPEPAVKSSPRPSATADSAKLFTRLEEMLLTIDWEVNSENILKAKDILGQLVKAKGWSKSSLIGQVTDQMDKVLSSMLESPENSSISAPSQLKKALGVIKKSETPGEAAEKNLETILESLRNLLASDGVASQRIKDDLQAASPVESIPPPEEQHSFDLGLEMEVEPAGTGQPDPKEGATVPLETAEVLTKHTTGIAEAIKLLTPMETLFANRPSTAKLQAATKNLKDKLSSQEQLFKQTFSADYTSFTGLGALNSWLESQLGLIEKCAARIGKMEKLFGKTSGYEKLHLRSRKIRKILEKRLDALTIAVGGTPSQHQFDLTGEYPAVIQPAPRQPEATPATASAATSPEAPPAVVSAVASPEAMVNKCISLAQSLEQGGGKDPQEIGVRIRKTLEKLKNSLSGAAINSPGASAAAKAAASVAGHATRCRWDWLLKTSWGGQLVGIAPEQVAYESLAAFPLRSFKDLSFFNLKKLKSLPWKNLQTLFTGELAELSPSVLNDLELEIANPPASFSGSTKKKVYLVILYSGEKGKVFLVDAPTEAISVAEDALWSPGSFSESDNIAGTLTVYGSTIPVVSID